MFTFYHSQQSVDNINYYKGTLFESLLQQYLRSTGFEVELRRKKNSLEYDIEGRNVITNQHVIGEAKAYENPVKGKELSSFVGKLVPLGLFENRVHGIFLSTSSLTPDAEDYFSTVRNYGITTKNGRELYGAIEAALKLPTFVGLSKVIDRAGYTPITSSILTTDTGIFIIVIARAHSSGTPAYFTIFDEHGHQIDDTPFINAVREADQSLQSLQPILLKKQSISVAAQQERSIPFGLTLGAEWTDYWLPASPQYFVGRQKFVEKVFLLLNQRQTPNIIQIKSRSGVGKSSVLAYIESLYSTLGNFTEIHDARDIKSVLDVFAVVQRFTKADRLAHDFKELETQIQTFSESNTDTLKLFFVDQFESTFHNPEVFHAYENVFDAFSRTGNRLYILIARKNDQLTTYDDTKITLDKLNATSKSFELKDFSKDEAIQLIREICREQTKQIGSDVRAYVLEFAQGFPWLLKRTMAHIVRLVNRGVSQKELFATGLRLDDLFDEELEGLDEIERDYIARIASRLPADYNQLQRQFDEDPLLPKILDKLTRSRLLRLTGATYDTYNDVFKEYLKYNKLPEFSYLCIYRQPPSTVLAAFHDSFEKDPFTSEELAKILKKSQGSVFNIVRELRSFNLIVADGDRWCIPQTVKDIYNRGRLGEYIRRQLLENEIISRLIRHVSQDGRFPSDRLTDYLQEQFPFIEAAPKTWAIYATILRAWVTETKLLELTDDLNLVQPVETRATQIENLGNMMTTSTLGRRGAYSQHHPADLFLPNCANFKSVEQTLFSLQNGTPIAEIKDRTALTDLKNGGWLINNRPTSATGEEFRNLVKEAITKECFNPVWEAVGNGQPALAAFQHLAGGYTEETLKWKLKMLVRWAKELGIIAKSRISVTTHKRVTRPVHSTRKYTTPPVPSKPSHPFEGVSYEQIKHYIEEHFPKVRGITRIDIARSNTHGWEIRIRRRGNSINEYFSDIGSGGIREAYESAIARLNVLEQDENLRPYTRTELSGLVSKRNTSGIVGVRKSKRSNKSEGYDSWTAFGAPRPGDHMVKSFSINKYGEEEAKRLAIAQRKEWEVQMLAYEREQEERNLDNKSD